MTVRGQKPRAPADHGTVIPGIEERPRGAIRGRREMSGTAYRIRTGDLRLERAVSWASRRMRLGAGVRISRGRQTLSSSGRFLGDPDRVSRAVRGLGTVRVRRRFYVDCRPGALRRATHRSAAGGRAQSSHLGASPSHPEGIRDSARHGQRRLESRLTAPTPTYDREAGSGQRHFASGSRVRRASPPREQATAADGRCVVVVGALEAVVLQERADGVSDLIETLFAKHRAVM
jgi:hypothetical protein